MTIKINIDSSAFEGALSRVGPDIKKAVYSAIATTNTATIKVARREHSHRHKTRSGTLNKSIMPTKSAKSRGIEIKSNIAKYGQYIHDGFKGWAPDPFLTSTFKEKWNKKHYQKKIIININRVLKRVF